MWRNGPKGRFLEEELWRDGISFPVETVEATYAFTKIGRIHHRFAVRAKKLEKISGTTNRANRAVQRFVFIRSGIILRAIVRVAKKHKKPSGMISRARVVVE